MSRYNATDWNTSTWAKLSHEYENRLVALQKELEGDLPENKTAKLRGRIAEVRRILALPRQIEVPHVEVPY